MKNEIHSFNISYVEGTDPDQNRVLLIMHFDSTAVHGAMDELVNKGNQLFRVIEQQIGLGLVVDTLSHDFNAVCSEVKDWALQAREISALNPINAFPQPCHTIEQAIRVVYNGIDQLRGGNSFIPVMA